MNALLKLVVDHDSAREVAAVARYERRRKWSRTDTARWLDSRSPTVLAWVRRKPGEWPHKCTNQMGYWLKDHKARIFDRAHARLGAGKDDEAREGMQVGDVLK